MILLHNAKTRELINNKPSKLPTYKPRIVFQYYIPVPAYIPVKGKTAPYNLGIPIAHVTRYQRHVTFQQLPSDFLGCGDRIFLLPRQFAHDTIQWLPEGNLEEDHPDAVVVEFLPVPLGFSGCRVLMSSSLDLGVVQVHGSQVCRVLVVLDLGSPKCCARGEGRVTVETSQVEAYEIRLG